VRSRRLSGGTSESNFTAYGRWLRQAKHDLQTAKLTVQNDAHDWACFLCQQAAEKALRAYLYLHGHRAVIGHSIFGLLKTGASHNRLFNDLSRIKRLDEVYISSRYPDALQEGTPLDFYAPEDSDECIALAEKTISTVEKLAKR
jgi:HEPN domain-containing protein